MNRKKRTSLCLVLALLFSLLPGFSPARAAEASPYGYIVTLRDPDAGQAALLSVPDLREISAPQGLYHADTLEEVASLGSRVERCEPDGEVRLLETPNDKYYSSEWSAEALNMPAVWDMGYTGKGVRVAVIDSGVNSMHADFAGTRFDSGYNVLNGSHDVTDENGHGSIVCGVIAETKNNGIGFAGLTPDVTIVPIKCFGKSETTDISYLVASIYAAVDDYACDVINLSLGTTMDAPALREAVEYAANRGVILVSAAGNDGRTTYNYPAAYDCAVGVGSVDKGGTVSSFSQKNDSVYVVAPGSNIYGPAFSSTTGYAKASGTSFSCPHVAAAAAILKQYAPAATYLDFETLLRASAVDGGAAGYDSSYGWGSLDMARFVAAMETYNFADIGTTFPDVEGHWAAQNIRYCVSAKLFSGVTASSFAPDTTMSRAMFVTVLSRMSGENISGFPNGFADVPDDAWYLQACGWGAAAQIVSGVGNGLFAPNADVTREQMAVFLYRYAQTYGLAGSGAGSLTGYADRSQVSSYAREAMSWAVGRGYITGRGGSQLAPLANATRAEVATICARFTNSIAA